LILKTVKEIENSALQKKYLGFISQDEDKSSHAPKIFKNTCKIKWNNDALKIYNLIRGLSPYPTAYTEYKDENGNTLLIKIFNAKLELKEHEQAAGSIDSDNKSFLKVYCHKGLIDITDLQLQGKRRMP